MSELTQTLADGTEIEPSVRDSLNTAMAGLYKCAKEAKDQAKANGQEGEAMSRQDAYVSFLNNVVTGPRQFYDPEGTGYQTTYKNANYRKAFGQQSPHVKTSPNSEIVDKLFGGKFDTLQGTSISSHYALEQPMTQDDEVIPVVPDDLDRAKSLVKSYVLEYREEASSWFDYMEGDKDALSDSTSSTTAENKDEWCDAMCELHKVHGIGASIIEDARTHFATKQDTVVIDPDEITKEVSLGDKYDSLDEYKEDHGASAVAELSPDEIAEIA